MSLSQKVIVRTQINGQKGKDNDEEQGCLSNPGLECGIVFLNLEGTFPEIESLALPIVSQRKGESVVHQPGIPNPGHIAFQTNLSVTPQVDLFSRNI